MPITTCWKSYEEVATYLLDKFSDEFDLDRVEGKQKVKGNRSGTEWAIDAKGVNLEGKGFIIVECRRYLKSKQNQEKLGALAYRIIDTGASGGIIVSPLGIQSGAEKVASAEEILEIQLDANSTPYKFAMGFLNKLMLGEHINFTDEWDTIMRITCQQCNNKFEPLQNERVCSTCASKTAVMIKDKQIY
ncbi:MAG: hypothetical protein R3F53_15135 [Gammaproteobacteria bacterium]